MLITEKLTQLLKLSSLTMFNTEMLVLGGIFYSTSSQYKTNLRNAQRSLQKLSRANYISFDKYPHKNRLCRFYYPTSQGLEYIGKKGVKHHEINAGLLMHDSLAALFLVHMFRCCEDKGISCKWHPPFDIDGKHCDGALSLSLHGRRLYTLILEADTGSHDHREIVEKCTAWLPNLPKDSKIVFLIKGEKRKNNLTETLSQEFANAQGKIRLFCPEVFSPAMSILSSEYP